MGTNGQLTPLHSTSDIAPSNTLNRNGSQSHLPSTFSYIWTTNDSIFENDVNRWIGGDTGSAAHASVPPLARLESAQPSLPRPWPLPSGFWYVAALVLPLVNLDAARNWSCTPSALLTTAELFLTRAAGYCSRARSRMHQLAQENAARDLFAGTMDIILVLYAIGFLFLSLYQAAVF